MSKKILVALGGNAILTDNPTAKGQILALEKTAKQLVKLVEAGCQLIISHGMVRKWAIYYYNKMQLILKPILHYPWILVLQ